MTVRDAIRAVNAKDGCRVSFRAKITVPCRQHKVDSWVGVCEYRDGGLVSLDGGSYDIDGEIVGYSFESGPFGEILSVYIPTE